MSSDYVGLVTIKESKEYPGIYQVIGDPTESQIGDITWQDYPKEAYVKSQWALMDWRRFPPEWHGLGTDFDEAKKIVLDHFQNPEYL